MYGSANHVIEECVILKHSFVVCIPITIFSPVGPCFARRSLKLEAGL